MAGRLVLVSALLALLMAAAAVTGEIFFHEEFNTLDGWVKSSHKSDLGDIELATGTFHGDKAINQGLKLTQDARFYAVSKKLTTPATNKGKDFVISFSLKNEQSLTCGGGYIKLLPASLDQKDFNGDSKYWIMFGPDRCGPKNLVHVILNYNNKNVDWKKTYRYPEDKLTHVYTLRISPDNTYELYVDNENKENGKLENDWVLLEEREIFDPSEKKPADWVDEPRIPDPEDKKPEDWKDLPAEMADPDATKPEDWSDEEDGEWEAPMVPNPEFKGEWTPRMIPNPEYKGIWKAKMIPNPKFTEDSELYLAREPIQYVGIDVWQVESGSIYDNIIIGDNLEEVQALIAKTYGATIAAEKALAEKESEERKAALQAAASKKGGAAKEDDDTPAEEEEEDADKGDL